MPQLMQEKNDTGAYFRRDPDKNIYFVIDKKKIIKVCVK